MPGAAQDKRLSAEREALRRLESERREEREGEEEEGRKRRGGRGRKYRDVVHCREVGLKVVGVKREMEHTEKVK